jgi:hypothetical protein
LVFSEFFLHMRDDRYRFNPRAEVEAPADLVKANIAIRVMRPSI